MSLRDQIESRSKEIRTDGYSMSIGEILSLYRDGDIEIHPEFQRIFRWKKDQKSRLVESVLLGIPIPSIFVAQRDDGIWDVIDGVQRLSTILEFLGAYRDEDGRQQPGSVLTAGEYLSDLRGYSWDGGEGSQAFDEAMQRDFKRAKLEFRIIMKGSDANAKYDLFQRLNSGSVLSAQESRNCLMVMINRDMYQRIVEMAGSADFSTCVQLSDRQGEQAYSQELVLRFFLQFSYDGPETELDAEFGEFITTWMRGIAARPGGPQLNEIVFFDTMRVLRDALGEDAFRRFDPERQRHVGPFSVASYEFITTGVAANIDRWLAAKPDELKSKVQSIWTYSEFRNNSGTGVSPRRRFPKLVRESRKYFAV